MTAETAEDSAFIACLFSSLGTAIGISTLFSSGVLTPATLEPMEVFVLGFITCFMYVATLVTIVEG